MQALVYRRSIPLYLLGGLLGKIWRRRFFPRCTPMSLKDIPFNPTTQGLDMSWVRLRTRLCGICGSDLGLLRGVESLLLEPYASFPCVLGHEVVAEVEEAPAGSDWKAGDRVVVEPILSCEARGLPPCRSCIRGDYNLCENFTTGPLSAGTVLGYTHSVGGGMAERMAAHPAQLVRVPDSMPDETAVLTDSLASALQPVLDNLPGNEDTAVVFGAGIIGQHIVRCLRFLGFTGRLVVVARYAFQRDLAKAGGADEILMSPDRKALGKALGARFLPTTLGGGNLEGGADFFYDCVGSAGSIQEGLLALRAKGRFVLVATAGPVKGLDLSSLWFRQLTVVGTAMYAYGQHKGQRVRTYELAMDMLAGAYPAEGLLTHLFPLADYAQAFRTVFNRRQARSMKVAFDLRQNFAAAATQGSQE